MDFHKEYQRWSETITEPELVKELLEMDEMVKEDAFYRHLSFGTGGLRGMIGAGTNRLNIYTVAKASQGVAVYLKNKYAAPGVIIGYDSRINSDIFARTAAEVFAANGIKVWFWPELTPVPTVSYAVRYLKLSAGIMITASHNPSRDNGYKVYGDDGCQITTEAAKDIYTEIKKVDVFDGVQRVCFEEAINRGIIKYVASEVLEAFLKKVEEQSVLFGDPINKDIKIVYSPLNGTGRIPVSRALNDLGYQQVIMVKEQELPDGNFPTCPFPNPEVKEAMALGIEYAKREKADLLLATDPDCDRVGVAVKDKNGEYVLISGNEMGVLLLDYICSQRIKHHTMPENPIAVKSIVTTDFGKKIAEYYGVTTVEVLTGFKYIGELIGKLEKENRKEDFIFGYEESYGYLSGDYVRDKDGVGAAVLICEMFCFHASKGIRLTDRLEHLYQQFGYCMNIQKCFAFEGQDGQERMRDIMNHCRFMLKERHPEDKLAGCKIINYYDYENGINDLPKANVLKCILSKGSTVVLRPSGTEPKLKVYYDLMGESEQEVKEKSILLDSRLGQILR